MSLLDIFKIGETTDGTYCFILNTEMKGGQEEGGKKEGKREKREERRERREGKIEKGK